MAPLIILTKSDIYGPVDNFNKKRLKCPIRSQIAITNITLVTHPTTYQPSIFVARRINISSFPGC